MLNFIRADPRTDKFGLCFTQSVEMAIKIDKKLINFTM